VAGRRAQKKERNLHRERRCRNHQQRQPQQRRLSRGSQPRGRSPDVGNDSWIRSQSFILALQSCLESFHRFESIFNRDLTLLKSSRNAHRISFSHWGGTDREGRRARA
jgi:hypothetical protein